MDRKNRRLSIALGLVLVALAAVAVVEWPRIRDWYRRPAPDLPAAADIVHLEAAAWAAGSRGYFESDVPQFVVPAWAVPKLWRRFEPNAYVSNPPVDKNAPLGELVARTADGRETRLVFYETGGDDVIFTTDGTHFFRAEPRTDDGNPLGGGLLLAGTLRQLCISTGQPGPNAKRQTKAYPHSVTFSPDNRFAYVCDKRDACRYA